MKERIFITVKTYPNLTKTGELVCTAGVTEDGRWLRIYPLPFRMLDEEQKFKKYQWITVDVQPVGARDPRPESRRLKTQDIELGEVVHSWDARKSYLFSGHLPIYTTRRELLKDKNEKGTSLAIFKPTVIKTMKHEAAEREWKKENLQKLQERREQYDLFYSEEDRKRIYSTAEKMPYTFSYRFLDAEGTPLELMVEDWEIGMYYRHCMERLQNEEKAIAEVKKHYMELAETRDIYLFLGTVFENHMKKAFNPFIIVGVFYPPKTEQMSLF